MKCKFASCLFGTFMLITNMLYTTCTEIVITIHQGFVISIPDPLTPILSFEKERTSQQLSRQVLSLEKRELPCALSKLFFDCFRTTDQGSIYLVCPPTGSIIDHIQLSCYLQSEVWI